MALFPRFNILPNDISPHTGLSLTAMAYRQAGVGIS